MALELALAYVHDTEGAEYLLLQPPGFQDFLTGTSTGETADTVWQEQTHLGTARGRTEA